MQKIAMIPAPSIVIAAIFIHAHLTRLLVHMVAIVSAVTERSVRAGGVLRLLGVVICVHFLHTDGAAEFAGEASSRRGPAAVHELRLPDGCNWLAVRLVGRRLAQLLREAWYTRIMYALAASSPSSRPTAGYGRID